MISRVFFQDCSFLSSGPSAPLTCPLDNCTPMGRDTLQHSHSPNFPETFPMTRITGRKGSHEELEGTSREDRRCKDTPFTLSVVSSVDLNSGDRDGRHGHGLIRV